MGVGVVVVGAVDKKKHINSDPVFNYLCVMHFRAVVTVVLTRCSSLHLPHGRSKDEHSRGCGEH